MISAVIKFSDNKVSIHSSETVYVDKVFEPGLYESYTDPQGVVKIEMTKLNEIHKPFLSENTNIILEIIDGFFKENVKDNINKLDYLHKIGILLFGKQGTGKTSMLNFIGTELVTLKDAIVFICNNDNNLFTSVSLARQIREIQGNPIIFIADEFERYAENAESEIKNLLDGNMSIDNMIFLAATNYINKVPDTIKNRPSRFKVVHELKGIDNKDVMKEIFTKISNKIHPALMTNEEINNIIINRDCITIDEIKHICLDKIMEIYVPKQKKDVIGFNKENTEETNYEKTYKITFPTIRSMWSSLQDDSKIKDDLSSNI